MQISRKEFWIKCQGDTRIRIGDILSIIGTDADEPLLNALFSHQVRIKSHSLYHGDKIYNADTPLIDLAEQFDFELTSFEKTLSLADMMSYQIGGFPEPGDEVNLIKVSLVVVELEGDKIKRVGLYLAQERTAEYERLRRAKFYVYNSELDNMQRRREEATKQLFDSIDDDEEYNT